MKPSFLLFILFTVASGTLKAQSNLPVKEQAAEGIIRYKFLYIPDTSKPDRIVQEDMELAFGKTASAFTSYSKKMRDAAIRKNIQKQMAANPNTSYNEVQALLASFNMSSQETIYTTAAPQTRVYSVQQIASSYYMVPDNGKEIDWKILDSTKTIQGNICQKATGESHGRTYTAWFCSDIPYSFGPRKLSGLPGMILEAYDQKREVVYIFSQYETHVNGEKIEVPANTTMATQKAFNKLHKAFQKDPATFRNNSPGNGNIRFITGVNTAAGGKQITKDNTANITVTNPIDLK